MAATGADGKPFLASRAEHGEGDHPEVVEE
jgi:hypothetical protein